MTWTDIIGPAVTAAIVSAVVTILTSWLSGRREARAQAKKNLEEHLLRFTTEAVAAAHEMSRVTDQASAKSLGVEEIKKYREVIIARRAAMRAEQLVVSVMGRRLATATEEVAADIESDADDIDAALNRRKGQVSDLGVFVKLELLHKKLRKALSIHYTSIPTPPEPKVIKAQP